MRGNPKMLLAGRGGCVGVVGGLEDSKKGRPKMLGGGFKGLSVFAGSFVLAIGCTVVEVEDVGLGVVVVEAC